MDQTIRKRFQVTALPPTVRAMLRDAADDVTTAAVRAQFRLSP